ncbi:hypothetical protein GTP58_20050 [Duganella sp. CY15W]|uniref:hypothetical protein n=1 Tax=Duganella sp. CY15W TaxID=2692172 RepID=UPI00136A721D|nr:hypothetical protein [Duganella sp. CY15W]MYM30629.1 hypothetical protein [Duganella sp. CY15W]
MNINEHYSFLDTNEVLQIELTQPVVNLLPALADMIQEAALAKRGFSQTARYLRFSWLDEQSKMGILQFLEKVTIAELVEREEQAPRLQDDREKFLALTAEEFAVLIEQTSNGKLHKVVVDKFNLQFSASKLLPITHFKKLAQLGSWDAKAQQFAYSLPLTVAVKDKLFDAISALSRSTKSVTKKDIAERRQARKGRKERHLGVIDADFDEAAEDFGFEKAREWQAAGRLRDLTRD